jgi:DNA-binding transcriptional MerR regulator
MSSYRISQLAERGGVPASTLRFYEGAGLLAADRTAAGYRVYGEDAVARLEFITSAKHLGLPLAEIRELLQVWQDGVCASVRVEMAPLVRARMDEAHRRTAELTAFTAHLEGVHQELSGPAPAGACGPGCGCVTAAGPAAVTAPVACSLKGSAMSGRVEEWQHLAASALGREAIPDGWRLTFPADPALATEITRLAVAEQECCPFFDFTLHLSAAALVLIVRASGDGMGLLTDLFGAGG